MWKMLGANEPAKANNVLTLICGIMNIKVAEIVKPSSREIDKEENKLRVVFDK